MKTKILIVEDDLAIAEGLKDNLELEGYEVQVATDGEAGLEQAVDLRPDLILLDVMMPKMNGFEVCRELRRLKITVPICMVTAKGEEFDRCLGLDLGADDYIVKPFSVKELLSRVKAQLRRADSFSGPDKLLSFGEVQVDFGARTIRRNNETLQPTVTELALLKYLAQHEDHVLSREQILDAVWGHGYYGTARTVDNFVRSLRMHIESDPAKPQHLLTVRGAGYRFVMKK